MLNSSPEILALDFDGVICDGLKEYFQSTWRAYCQIWQAIDSESAHSLAPQFYRLRPVIETGWEMPVLLRAIVEGIPESEILQDWSAIAPKLVTQYNLNATMLSSLVDQVRDEWIATDLSGWFAEQRFYPGVAEKLSQWISESLPIFIISTKEGRFIRELLQQQNVDPDRLQIFGKEAKRPKPQILREILTAQNSPGIWFVEDRLKTLQAVQKQAELASVGLLLADWGYNTEDDRQIAQKDDRIHLISLDQFTSDFSSWV
jgi:phosphoglycolate phosphatase-like HAD superfamily hydrolase